MYQNGFQDWAIPYIVCDEYYRFNNYINRKLFRECLGYSRAMEIS